jgi:hypothetical protein
MELLSRSASEARALGASKYFTGKPCSRGHVAERHTSTMSCVICQRMHYEIARKEDPERRNEISAAWRARNPEAFKQSKRANYERNAEAYRARSAEWRAANPEVSLEVRRRWRQANPDAVRAQRSMRRAAELNRHAGWDRELTELVVREAADLARRRTDVTGHKWHVDHVVPLRGRKVSGLHVWNNLAVIPAVENAKKNNKFEIA